MGIGIATLPSTKREAKSLFDEAFSWVDEEKALAEIKANVGHPYAFARVGVEFVINGEKVVGNDWTSSWEIKARSEGSKATVGGYVVRRQVRALAAVAGLAITEHVAHCTNDLAVFSIRPMTAAERAASKAGIVPAEESADS